MQNSLTMHNLNSTEKEQRTANTGLAKVAVQCSADTLVVNHPESYRDGENRHLRKARKPFDEIKKMTNQGFIQNIRNLIAKDDFVRKAFDVAIFCIFAQYSILSQNKVICQNFYARF